jgi:hypothetical protein
MHIEKYLWILTFQKTTQMATFYNNNILNKKFIFHFIIQLMAKYYQANNLITQDLWIHLQLVKD